MTATVPTAVYDRLGEADREFVCCDTTFLVRASGVRADRAAEAARRTAAGLEAQLNAFDEGSAVSRLNDAGRVENEHVARLVRRGREYVRRTGGAFDVRCGRFEHDLKAYLRGERDERPAEFDGVAAAVEREAADGEVAGGGDSDESDEPIAGVRTEGDRVEADAPVDLNGLAKGYIVDRAAEALAGIGRRGFVSGGGDMSPPTGPVAVESPYGDAKPLAVVETDWAVATSGGYRRRRNGVDHVYDPTDGRVGSRHDSVTVLARRDCTEADALATTLAALPLEAALDLAEEWSGLEALVVHEGVFHRTEGFDDRAHH